MMLRPSWPTNLARALLLIGSLIVFTPNLFAQNFLIGDAASNTIKQFNGVTGAYMGIFAQGGGLSVPYGMAYGPDGNLYVASEGNGKILEYNGTTGAFIGTFASQATSGLIYPNDIAFGPDGNLYVTSFNANAVLKYEGPKSATTPGTYDGVFATTPGLQGATGLAFNQNAGGSTTLFVSSSGNGQIFQFNSTTGALIGGGPYINDQAHVNGTAGFTFGLDGNLYATSFYPTANTNPKAQVAVYDTSLSSTSASFSSLFTSSNALNGTADILLAAPASNHFYYYVTNYNTGTVYRFDAATGVGSSTPFINNANLTNPLYIVMTPTVAAPAAQGLGVVPEPASFVLMGIGASVLAFISRRREMSKISAQP